MATQNYLDSLVDLNGKTAVVTGGTQGIGLQTTLLLARKGATVYVCALDGPKDREGLASAQKELNTYSSAGAINFHPLDLSSIKAVKSSVEDLKNKIGEKLDIVICNAGIAFPPLSTLSLDGYERTFAVNCLGHFVFISSLLDLVEHSALLHGSSRITITSSQGYIAAKKLNYEALQTAIPKDGTSLLHLGAGFQRYLDSKLAVLYLTLELDKRLQARGVMNVYVNACHPGQTPKTRLGSNQQPLIGPHMESAIKNTLGLFMRQSPQDSAKTQVFLSASSIVLEQDIHGQYWAPRWSWAQKFVSCKREELKTTLAKDEAEWGKLWDFCENAVQKAK